MKFEVGKTYRGLINGCLIKIIEFNKDNTITYVDIKTNKKGNAPVTRLEHSKFEEVK